MWEVRPVARYLSVASALSGPERPLPCDAHSPAPATRQPQHESLFLFVLPYGTVSSSCCSDHSLVALVPVLHALTVLSAPSQLTKQQPTMAPSPCMLLDFAVSMRSLHSCMCMGSEGAFTNRGGRHMTGVHAMHAVQCCRVLLL